MAEVRELVRGGETALVEAGTETEKAFLKAGWKPKEKEAVSAKPRAVKKRAPKKKR